MTDLDITQDANLTSITAPALVDRIPIVRNSDSVLGDITVQNLRGGYVLTAAAASFDPADGTTYYFGSRHAAVPGTTAVRNIIGIPRAGTITAVSLLVNVAGTLGTSENSTVSLRLNNTSDTTIVSTLDLSGVNYLITVAVSVAVVTTDFLELKWATPTWVTNPTTVIPCAWIYVS
jgi:hypothetical protein